MELQDLLRHIADNVENGKVWSDGIDINDEAAWAVSVLFGEADSIKLKPRTHVVNGFTVPAPEVEAPSGEYCFSVVDDKCFYGVGEWTEHRLDKLRLMRGLIHLTEEAAVANAKAMLGIDPYSETE